jgi:hypothetical protein
LVSRTNGNQRMATRTTTSATITTIEVNLSENAKRS